MRPAAPRGFALLRAVMLLALSQCPGVGASDHRARAAETPVGTILVDGAAMAIDGRAADASGPTLAKLVIQAWYPAAPRDARSPETRGNRPASPIRDAPVAGEPELRPVVFFNPGWGGTADGHTLQIMALVRGGFVVVAIWHRPQSDRPTEFLDFSSDAAYRDSLNRIARLTEADARDNVAVLDSLEHNAIAPLVALGTHLDFRKVGILGYSYGGAVAAQTCWLDRRFRAAINMDGWLFAEAADQGFEQPFLEMSDATPLPNLAAVPPGDVRARLEAEQNISDERLRQARLARFGGTTLVVDGTDHQSFVDPQARSLAGQMLAAWRPDGRRKLTIITEYAVAFFRLHLAGQHTALLDAPTAPYPDAHLTTWTSHDPLP